MARSVGIDLGTTNSVVSVTGGSALPKDDIDRMVREAERHAEEDRRRREAAEARNQAEQLVRQTERLIKDNPDKIPADAKSETETALADLKERLKDENADTASLRQAMDRTTQAARKIGTALYEKSRADGSAQESAGASQASGGSEEAADAEIVDDDTSEAG
jgi:molecular chaperone DnaK